MSSKSKLILDSPSRSPAKSVSPAKGKKGAKEPKEKKTAKEEQKVAPAKGKTDKSGKKENERPKSKSATKGTSPDKKKAGRPASQTSNKSPAKGKGKAVKQPQESVSPKKKSQSKSPLKKLNKDVEAMKKKGPKEETKKSSKEDVKNSSKAVPGHDYKTQPKKPTGSYLFFNTATTKRLKEEDEELDHPAAFKKSSELWGKITEKDKAPWEALAAKDVERFDKETKDLAEKGFFITKDGVKSTDLPVDPKKKWGKDIICPKPARSAYSYFTAENLVKIREKHSCKHTEAMGFASKEWNSLTEKQMQPFEEAHKKDQLRHSKEEAHLVKHGWFTNEDGVKSTDMEKKIKREKKQKEEAEMPSAEKIEKIKRKKD
jgi:hypothetical protein